MKVLRRITVDTGKARAIGTVVINRGRRTALAQAHLVDDSDRLLAHATSGRESCPVPTACGGPSDVRPRTPAFQQAPSHDRNGLRLKIVTRMLRP